jgi:hypothetical protein
MNFVGGLPETRCGGGSTLAYTEGVRAHLPQMLRALRVTRLFDAPCGDFNWLSRTDLSGIDYVGADIDPAHVAATLSRASDPPEFAPRSKSAMIFDLVKQYPPAADAMLCRDFLQHLPERDVVLVLSRFRISGLGWLIAPRTATRSTRTSRAPAASGRSTSARAPFGFPDPIESIADGDSRILGAWPLEDVR